MLSEELKKRLSLLNRGELKNLPVSEKKADIIIPKREKVTLESVIKGTIKDTGANNFILIEQTLADFMEEGRQIVSDFLHQINRLGLLGINEKLSKDILMIPSVQPEEILFLDIETCGLSATPLFLIGVMFLRDGDFVFYQLFARDYSGEKEILEYLVELLQQYKLLITFNGKSFDFPFIQDRSIANRVRLNSTHVHIDLLHESRRLWKNRLPNCKLQTIEKYICRRFRSGDIPGDEIPQVYHDYVKTGNAFRMGDILYHNVVDLLTMAEILTYIIKQVH